jgi:hypothetical protein
MATPEEMERDPTCREARACQDPALAATIGGEIITKKLTDKRRDDVRKLRVARFERGPVPMDEVGDYPWIIHHIPVVEEEIADTDYYPDHELFGARLYLPDWLQTRQMTTSAECAFQNSVLWNTLHLETERAYPGKSAWGPAVRKAALGNKPEDMDAYADLVRRVYSLAQKHGELSEVYDPRPDKEESTQSRRSSVASPVEPVKVRKKGSDLL